MKKLDLTGQRFGKWVVIERVISKIYCSKWFCKCDCGTVRQVKTSNLRNGSSTKCSLCRHGCKPGDSAFNSLIKAYKVSAEIRNLEFSLSEEKIREFLTGNCWYCGREPLNIRKITGCRGVFVFNGIDRKDSSIGYIEENCVSCCKECNYMKRDMSVNDFIDHIKKILKYRSQ